MNYEEKSLLSRLAGEQFSYGESLTMVEVPISAIVVDRVITDTNSKLRTTKNGKSDYTHSAAILHKDSRCPDELKTINSLGLLDWQVAPILVNHQIDEGSLPTITRARQIAEGVYDCALLKVTVVQRIVGETYQRKGGEPFTTIETPDYPAGTVRLYYEVSPVDALTLPNYVQDAKLSALVTASAASAQRQIEENAAKQRMGRTVIPKFEISEEKLAARKAASGFRNVIAEKNSELIELTSKLSSAKTADAKVKIEEAISKVNSEIESKSAELAKAEEAINN
ncbi:MAG: hypothetical protein WCR68_02160 [Candidatus Dojkabacteria bacterium]